MNWGKPLSFTFKFFELICVQCVNLIFFPCAILHVFTSFPCKSLVIRSSKVTPINYWECYNVHYALCMFPYNELMPSYARFLDCVNQA